MLKLNTQARMCIVSGSVCLRRQLIFWIWYLVELHAHSATTVDIFFIPVEMDRVVIVVGVNEMFVSVSCNEGGRVTLKQLILPFTVLTHAAPAPHLTSPHPISLTHAHFVLCRTRVRGTS